MSRKSKNRKKSEKKKKKSKKLVPLHPLHDLKKKAKEGRDWSNLPVDILSLIVSRLVAVEEIRFRGVCKSWQSIRMDVWVEERFGALVDHPDRGSPWLVFSLRNVNKWRFLNFLRNVHLDITIPSELTDCMIRCSADGWVLMERYRVNLFLFNPLTERVIRLPKTPRGGAGFPIIAFNFSSSNHCTVVGLDYYINYGFVGIWKLGEQEWKNYAVKHEIAFYNSDHNMVLHRGKCYCLASNGGLAVFSANNVEESWTVWKTAIRRNNEESCFHPSYLAESNGVLLGVFEMLDGKIKVFSMNEKMKVWEEIKSVGSNQMLFLSPGRCFSQVSNIKGLGNKIYFPKFARASGSSGYMVYSPTTREFTSLNGEFSTSDVYGLRDIQHSCWLLPASYQPRDEENIDRNLSLL